ncbi:TRP-like ion channel Pkd2, partial [Homalodisca vitripennis]
WKYKTAENSSTASIEGILTNYNGGGYVALLQNIDTKSEQTILKLRNGKWIDRSTRAMFIEFTIYNGNINLFCTFKIIFEFPPCGGVIPSHWNYVQKFIKYNDSYDMFIFFCEIVFCIFVIFYTFQKLAEIVTLRLKLLKSFWNWIDIIILVACYMVVILDILLYVEVHESLPELVSVKNQWNYASFDQMFYIHILYSYSFAVLIAFAFFKLLKYLSIVYVMHQLQSTISRAIPDIINYSILFLYVYFAFALVGHFLFGSQMEDYKSFPMAVFALMRSSVGDFNYYKLVQADPFYGPIFFFAFIFFIAFILVNVFLAILVSKYEEVRSEVRIGGAKTFIGEMISFWAIRLLEKAECNWLLSQIERKRFEKKVRSPTEAIRQYLRQAGYSELEIELFFKKYDITDSKIAAMDEDKFSYRQGEREAPPPLTQKDILRYIVIQKLEYLENHYQAANRLIDEFLSKLSKFEGRR